MTTAIVARHHKPEQPAFTMRLATLRARLALTGWVLHTSNDGAHMITRWGMAKHCNSLDAVEAFARQVGVRP